MPPGFLRRGLVAPTQKMRPERSCRFLSCEHDSEGKCWICSNGATEEVL